MRALACAVTALALAATTAWAAPTGNCEDLVRHLPNVSQQLCQQAQLHDSGARSVRGAALWVRDVDAPHAQLRVLVLGAIHGDELSAASLAMHWVIQAQQPPIPPALPVHWRFVPVLNPDGLFAKPPTRVNAHGVDLNRNFPTTNWDHEAPLYWTARTHKDPRRWPGPKPLSEPESRYLFEQIQQFKPQLIVSVHAPYGVLDFDGPRVGAYVPPSKLGRLYLDRVGIYPGSLGNYGGVHQGVPVVTIELPNATRTPLDAEMGQMWLDLNVWISKHLQTRQTAVQP